MSAAGRPSGRSGKRRAGMRCAQPAGPRIADPVAFDAADADRRARRLVRAGAAAHRRADRAAATRRAQPAWRRRGRPGAALGAGAAAAGAEPAQAAVAVAAERPGAGDPVAAGGARPRPVQARADRAPAAAEPARIAASRSAGGGAAFSRAAGARRSAARNRRRSAREMLAVLDDPDLAELWGPNSQRRSADRRADRRQCPRTQSQALSGQIDRVVVTDKRVLIVDFKTVRPVPPARRRCRRLSAAACDLPRCARPDLSRPPVECALLWTDGPV